MKKIFGILVLGLLWGNVGFAEEKIVDPFKIAEVNTYLNKGYKLHSINIASDDSGIFYHLIKKDDFITCVYFILKTKAACFRP